jgi:hypothetical protein
VVIVFSSMQLLSKLFFWLWGNIKQRHNGHVKSAICHYDLMSRNNYSFKIVAEDRLCGLVVRVPGCRSRGLGSISGATRFSEK